MGGGCQLCQLELHGGQVEGLHGRPHPPPLPERLPLRIVRHLRANNELPVRRISGNKVIISITMIPFTGVVIDQIIIIGVISIVLLAVVAVE